MPTLAPSITASNGPCWASHSWISQMFINRYIKYYKCFKQGEMEQVSSIHQGNAIYIFLYKKKESDNIISTSIFYYKSSPFSYKIHPVAKENYELSNAIVLGNSKHNINFYKLYEMVQVFI